MADLYERQAGTAGGGLRSVQRLVNLAAAATSLALVGGLAVWGYQIAVRDVSGIPVVKALAGPMRIAPVEPGGEIASHIGLSVNAIAAEGEEIPPAERLVLAPRAVDLAPEDLPATGTAPEAAAVPAADPSSTPGIGEDAAAPIIPVAPVEVPTETVPAVAASALVVAEGFVEDTEGPEAMGDADDLAEEGGVELASLEPAAEALPAIEPAPAGALTKSPRPLARPSEMVVLATASATASAPTVAKSVDPQTIKTGTRLVQLGAFDNESDAIAEWNRLTAQFGSLLADKSRVLQAAQSGGRDFVRLRAMGFADEGDARRFCSALLAENAACIPVAQR